MPKDEPSHPPPLKRGDACLYCRKRRIRCSAEKPTCSHCLKSGRECVYDSGKPVSRVKQLEEKVAQLENLLQRNPQGQGQGQDNAGGSSRRESADTDSHPPPLVHHSSSGTSNQSLGNADAYQQQQQSSTSYGYAGNTGTEDFDMNMLDSILAAQPPSNNNMMNSFASFGGAFFSGNVTSAETGATDNFFGLSNDSGNNANVNSSSGQAGPSIESLFDFNLLDPNYMNMLNSFDTTLTNPDPNPQSFQNPPVKQMQPQQSTNIPYQTQTQTQSQPPAPPPQTGPLISSVLDAYLPKDEPQSQPPNSRLYGYVDPNTDNDPLPRQPDATYGFVDINNDKDWLPMDTDDITPASTSSTNRSKSFSVSATSGGIDDFSAYLQPSPSGSTLNSSEIKQAAKSRQAYVSPESIDAIDLLNQVESTMVPTAGPGRHTTIYSDAKTAPAIDSDADERRQNPQQWVTGITDSSPSNAPAGIGTKGPVEQEEFKDSNGFTLVGGWFDANDLPKVARDHLLDLFFSGMRLFGQEFHVPRFMASLTLPANKRPHPCLLYTMYTLASRISDSPPIRHLEQHFYKIASSQLEQSIGMADRLLDATRASTLLAIYKFSKARYHEGWMMTGQAARLAISCGLHQIPSSVYKPPTGPNVNADLAGMMRHRSFVLPPPKDAIDLGERIWCFWSIYITDRCGSISTQWPPAIADDVVTTPFPRPLHEYELGLVTEQDDMTSVQSIYKPTFHHNPLPHYTETTLISIRLRSISILERASKLMYVTPEEGWEHSIPSHTYSAANSTGNSPASNIDDYLFSQIKSAAGLSTNYQFNPSASGAGSNNKGWTRTARIRTPKAYEEVKQALLRIESDLPPEWRVEWWKWDGKVQEWHFTKPRKDLITLHFVLGCAWMFLYDVFSFNAENTDAINVAKRLTVTVRFVRKDVMTSDLDVFIAMTWSFISKILIREMKRLQSIGDVAGANELEPDISVLVTALKEFGTRYAIGTMQAMRTERYKKSTKEEMDFLSKVNGAVQDPPENGDNMNNNDDSDDDDLDADEEQRGRYDDPNLSNAKAYIQSANRNRNRDGNINIPSMKDLLVEQEREQEQERQNVSNIDEEKGDNYNSAGIWYSTTFDTQ
uniref:Zn(2)-C6 fungal-type domain-containing protein n=1 Tax=Kwoniella dejecticola CBS 10117 TaxID=1296121 RepID=A0A1A5ZX17_9TREE|nr:uncharacterized protein I303_07111 [Kwoniella dejecticola CBS 10117]OBR82352.1 hypothetical protein I303_07111 [Kwoniella dejecticola CBS 10117]